MYGISYSHSKIREEVISMSSVAEMRKKIAENLLNASEEFVKGTFFKSKERVKQYLSEKTYEQL